MIAIAVIGLALVVMPFAFSMFTKAPKGATMIAQFKPFMTVPRLSGYQHDLRVINAGVQQTATAAAFRLDATSPSHAAFDSTYPTFAAFKQQWPAIDSTMTHLMNEVRGNLGNYQAVAALPSFRLFPWFFVIPGVLLAGLAGLILWRPARGRRARVALVVIGVGLIAAPAVFQMFSRAPKGGKMMTAFTTIETTRNVQQIQGFFGSMAEGQGAIRLEIVPGLAQSGLSLAQIRAQFPAVSTLDTQWVGILNDMTPMIGAMSDNVANYQAAASLPSFPLFPWFFVAPGLLVAGLGVAAGRRRPAADSPHVAVTSVSPARTSNIPEHIGVS
jgi:hypothetical protein